MSRPVTAMLGPTNTGKTHLAMERMSAHRSGMIGFPLRLLARENYERLVALKGAEVVALVTGEERIIPRRASYWIATVEAMPLDLKVDFLGVDEVQLAADRERGHVFTDRVLHARGTLETCLIGAETIRPLLRKLVPQVFFETHPRLSRLSYAQPKRLSKLPPRSAVIVFSLRELYEVAGALRRERGGAALVFGALSPRTRNAQVALYQAGEVDHLVATDAIGMGLNLDIDTVVFTGLAKFDGVGPRALTPAEVGQIAGRAGRHRRDGQFAATVELGPLDPRLVTAVESHRFAPLGTVFWRTDDLDFFSPLALLASLERQPPHPFLVRTRYAEDAQALAALVRDAEVMSLARGSEAVRLLWEVCQVPDFQGVLTEAHTRLLGRVYRFLRAPGGRIPEDFLASHVRALDRTDGDVDALLGRIAAIRTWTYLSNRVEWLPDAAQWQRRTRAVEDRLSDALHERLTQEFVDRAGAVIARHEAAELVTTIGEDGAVAVQGLRAGVLEGFRFHPDREARDSRTLLAAANRALRELVPERVQELEGDADAAFAFGPGPELLWRGAAVARVVAGEGALAPRVEVIGTDLLDPPLRERVRRRLAAWLEARLRSVLAPLFVLRERAPAGAARGLAFALAEGLGAVSRRTVAAQVAALGGEDRRALSRLGVTVGRLAVFLSALQAPAAARLRALLYAVRNGQGPEPGADGRRPSVPADASRPPAFYLAHGYLPLGPRAVRLDRLEHAAAITARLSQRGPFLPPRELPRILGCPAAELPAVLSEMGYTERGGRFERRQHGPRGRSRKPQG